MDVTPHNSPATEALNQWQGKEFDTCLGVLEQLRKQKPQDPKVLHNIAIVKFCKNGSKDFDEILRSLLEVKASLERDERWAPDDKSENTAYLKTAELAVVSLNMAIIRYQQREIKEVLAVLEPLFARIGPLDDGTAFRVCLLLLDIYIPEKEFQKAKNVLGFLDRTHGNLFKSDEVEGEQSVEGDKDSVGPKLSGIGQTGDSSSSNTDESEDTGTEAWPLSLPSLSKMGVVPLQLGPRNGDARSDKDKGGALDLKILIHLYRAKLLFAINELRMLKREVKCVLSVAPTSIPALFLKAQYYFRRGNVKRAAKILSRCVEGTSEPSIVRVAALCNMGAIYHQMGKHNSACLCFSNALKQNAELGASGESVLELPAVDPSTLHDQRLKLLYNAGLQHLLLRRYILALNCFKEVASLMFNQPMLWLRMGESCLGLHHEAMGQKSCGGVAGEDSQDKPLLEPLKECGPHKLFKLPDTSLEASKDEAGVLSEASTYLKNACFLLEQQEQKLASQEKGEERVTPGGSLESANGHTGMGSPSQDVAQVRQLALCKMAYVHLLLEQPERALTALEPIMNIKLSNHQIALMVNCYAAEALCLLDRPSEAANQLRMFVTGLNNHEDENPSSISQPENCAQQEQNGGQPDNYNSDLTGQRASATLYINLASIYATQGDFPEAGQCAQKALSYDPQSRHAVLVLVYLELVQGDKDRALALLKREQ